MSSPAWVRRADASDVAYDSPIATRPLELVEQSSHYFRAVPPEAFSAVAMNGVTLAPGDWKTRAFNQIEKLMTLAPNWDSYGAKVLSSRAATIALETLENIMATAPGAPEPEIVPTSKGGLQLEWELRHGDLSIEVEPSGRVLSYQSDAKTGEEFEGELEDVPCRPEDFLLRR